MKVEEPEVIVDAYREEGEPIVETFACGCLLSFGTQQQREAEGKANAKGGS